MIKNPLIELVRRLDAESAQAIWGHIPAGFRDFHTEMTLMSRWDRGAEAFQIFRDAALQEGRLEYFGDSRPPTYSLVE